MMYLSQDHTQLVHLGGASGATRTDFDTWINPELEILHWVSRWGAQKPWCSMVGPRTDLDWEQLSTEGIVKPNSRLACIGLDGTALPSVNLPSPFTHARIDPSGKSVVFYNNLNSENVDDLMFIGRRPTPGTLFNPKLAAVVDLGQGEARTLSVEGFGAQIQGVLFPSQASGDNQVQVAGKNRRLASFWGNKELVLVDLDDPALSQIAVSVRAAKEERRAPLVRLIPSGPGVKDPLVLVAGDSRDLDQIRLLAREGKPSQLDADYSILTTVAPARDLELVEIEKEAWLLSATPVGLSMIDLKSSRETLIEGMGALREIRTFVDPSGKTMVLGVPDFGDSISTIEPAKALTSLGRQPTVYNFGHEFRRVLSLDKSRIAVLGSSSLTVLDLATGKTTPLAGIDDTDSVTYSGGDYLYLFSDTGVSIERKLSLVRVQLSTMLPESQVLQDKLDGAAGFVKLNGGQGLAIRQYRNDSDDFGLGYIDVNSPSLSDYTTTWHSM